MSDAAELVSRLTIEEKVALLSGSDVWRTAPVERLGLPAIKVTDGPNGARGDSTTGAKAVCLPAAIAMAATFDTDLVVDLGRLLGREALRKGSHVLLAPTINMARHPLGGRNFESFGEEPILTSAMAVAYIEGVQSEGVGACAKHFVANDIEENRLTVSSELDDATLREVYLAPFEAAVEAGVWTIMAAYPKLNGEHCTEHPWLLTDLLRDEWGFDGLVMSDWGATHHPTRSVEAGLDLEMPGPPLALGAKLLAALEAGEIDEAVIDRRAENVVALAMRAGRMGSSEEPEQSVDLPEERALARRAAAAGMVLLTNQPPPDTDQPVLPLAAATTSIAVIGPNADPGVIQGGGSAQLPAHREVSPVAGLRESFPDAAVTHHRGCLADRYVPQPEPSLWVATGAEAATDAERPVVLEVFDRPVPEGEPLQRKSARTIFAFHHGAHPAVPDHDDWSQRWTATMAVGETGLHRFGVLAVGRSRVLVDGRLIVDNWTDPRPGQAFFEMASEEVIGEVHLEAGTTAEVVVEWSRGESAHQLAGLRFGHLPPVDEDRLMADAEAAAADADAAVVVVGLTAEWETESHDRVLYGLPGRQDELVRRVVGANPRTVVVVNAGGPIDLPWLDEVPAAIMAWYPGQEFGGALADVVSGRVDPAGRLPVTFPRSLDRTPTAGIVPGDGRHLKYSDGLFIGHRWYDEHAVEPRLAFGHGGSYGTYRIDQPVERADGRIEVPVTNVGDRSGTCVVQAYLRPGAPGRPRVLAGFASVALEAGASASVAMELAAQALRRWDSGSGSWQAMSGEHRLEIGTSSTEIIHRLTISR